MVAQAPEHFIENLKLDEKAKDGKKVVKRKPPEHNFANWDLQTFKRLMAAPPERLTSRFEVSHGMLLNVLSRRERRLPRHAGAHPRQPRDRPREEGRTSGAPGSSSAPWSTAASSRSFPRTAEGSRVRVNVDLQEDFSMNHALSLYLFETIPLLEPESETHALDLLTLVESILENPELILRRQLDKLKDRKVAEMKAEGLDYDQRMAELEKMEYPKPLRDFVYMTFNAFADRHPWVGEENIRPKSIAREMFEGFRSFSDYVQEYDLERAEGLLLRHLNSVYKVLSPDRARHASRPTPSSRWSCTCATCCARWTRACSRSGSGCAIRPTRGRRAPAADMRPPRPEEPPDVTRDTKAFTAAIRTRAVRVPARVVDRRRRGRAGAPRLAATTPTARPGRRRGCARRARRTAPSTPGCASTPRRATSATPTCSRRRGQGVVARPADAGRHRGAERLGGRARGRPRRVARRAASRCSGCYASAPWADRAGAGQQQLALARVARERRRALELGARLVEAAELGQQVAAHARQQVVARERRLRRAARRRAPARPRARTPSPTATARFSSTTGEGATAASVAYSAAIRGQSVSAAVRARAWQAAIAACSAYGPARAAQRLGPLERGEPAADEQLIPARAVLVEQQDRLARRPDARAASREAWISISATSPCTSGSCGASSARMRPRRSASSHSAGPHPVVARGRRVALVEDEVDRPPAPTTGGPRGSAPRGTSNGTRASASVRLARTIRWAIVASGTRKARAISSVVRPPSSRRVSATRASVESTGMAGREHQPQQVVADVVVERGVEIRRGGAPPASSSWPSSLVLALEQLAPAEVVDGPVLGRGHQPGARVVRDARLRPLLERGDQRVLGQLLGQRPRRARCAPGRR